MRFSSRLLTSLKRERRWAKGGIQAKGYYTTSRTAAYDADPQTVKGATGRGLTTQLEGIDLLRDLMQGLMLVACEVLSGSDEGLHDANHRI